MNLTGAETAPNIAEIIVLDDKVTVRLEVYIGDLESFADLIPDELLNDGGEGRPSERERLANFAQNVFSIRASDGQPLSARLKTAEPRLRVDRKSAFAGMINPSTRQRAPEAPADKRVLFVELDYPLEGRPSVLTISPPRDADGNPLVSIGFIAYHKAVPVIDFRFLSTDTILHLDWDDPWYSRFENRNLRRHHKNALMSFLYVEAREVRHEILVRVRDLQDWTDLALDDGAIIGLDEQATLKRQARTFFEAHNPLRIDGELRQPASSRAEFLSISVKGLALVEEAEPLELSTAIVGVILSYPVRHLPQKVEVEWELFNERNLRIPATAIDAAGPLPSFVDAENATIVWQNFLRQYVEPEVIPVSIETGSVVAVPAASLLLLIVALIAVVLAMGRKGGARVILFAASVLCVAAALPLARSTIIEVRNPLSGPPNEEQATAIVTAALNNVHNAYLERVASELTRALSVVVAQGSASELRTELDRALAIKVAGGGTARVNAIEDLVVKDIAAIDGRHGFRCLAEWTALASAGHWGHGHRRRIRFRALMELEEIDGHWKLSALTVVDRQQI